MNNDERLARIWTNLDKMKSATVPAHACVCVCYKKAANFEATKSMVVKIRLVPQIATSMCMCV